MTRVRSFAILVLILTVFQRWFAPTLMDSYNPRLAAFYLQFNGIMRVEDVLSQFSPARPSSWLISNSWPSISNPNLHLHHILITGQSLALGVAGDPVLTQKPSFQNISFFHGKVVPLSEFTDHETIASSMASMITVSSPQKNYQTAVGTHAGEGYFYRQLKRNEPLYTQALKEVKLAKDRVAAVGGTYDVSALVVIHGESDQTQPPGTYSAYLKEWIADYNTDVKAITGQKNSFPMLTDQMGSFTAYGFAKANSALEQLKAAEENPNNIILVGPKYFLPYADGVHLTNTSYRWLGEYYGKVYKQAVIDKKPWKPLSPKSITRSGNIISVKFFVPSPPIQIDTQHVLEKSNYGFEYDDNSQHPPQITEVKVVESDAVQITLSSVPTGKNQRLRYAYTGTINSLAGPFEAGSARGNIRDSDAAPSLYGNNLFNWLVHFDKSVQ